MRASLKEEGGQFDVLCATRTIAALLQEFYTGRNVSTLCVQASLNVILRAKMLQKNLFDL